MSEGTKQYVPPLSGEPNSPLTLCQCGGHAKCEHEWGGWREIDGGRGGERISELEAERDEAIAAARAFKHAFDIQVTQADIDRAVAEAIRLRPQMDAEKARRILETEINSKG